MQREALELVKKRNHAGVTHVIEKAQRLIEGMPARVVKTDKSDAKPAVSKFDLATLIYTVDTWSMDMVKGLYEIAGVKLLRSFGSLGSDQQQG